MKVLVIDLGGTHAKLCVTGTSDVRRFDSGRELTPQNFVARVDQATADWTYDVISLGYPGRVSADGPVAEPGNLGRGWIGFDFEKALARPVRIVNDAAMQALGAYNGRGRMLFLGLGTGLGSVLVAERVVIPLELGSLRLTADGERLVDRLGRRGLERLGDARWADAVRTEAVRLRDVFIADYVVLGGGHAAKVDRLPPGVRAGGNEDACIGGFRLWEEIVEPHDQAPRHAWRVVR
jgi:polyphosphate glucokinase